MMSEESLLDIAISETAQRIPLTDRGFSPTDMAGVWKLSEIYVVAGMCPDDFLYKKNPNGQKVSLPQHVAVAKVAIAIELGYAVGLSTSQSVQSIMVTNGRPTIWGDSMKALCEASPLCLGITEVLSGEGDEMGYTCTALRAGRQNPVVYRFTVADAKRANLWGGRGPWTTSPKRMLQMRARGFCLRDAFPDVLKGLACREEVDDYSLEAAGITARVEPQWSEIPKEHLKKKVHDEVVEKAVAEAAAEKTKRKTRSKEVLEMLNTSGQTEEVTQEAEEFQAEEELTFDDEDKGSLEAQQGG